MNSPRFRWWSALGCWLLCLAASPLEAHGNFHDMITDLNAKVLAAPAEAGLRLDRARIYLEHEELESARQDLEEARKLDPNSARGVFLQARWHKLSKHWEEARKGLTVYLKREPTDTAARRDLLDVFCAQEETKLALAELDTLLAMTKEGVPDLVLRRVELTELEDAPGALAWLEGWIAKHPQLVVWEQAALRLEMKLERTEAVLARFDRLQAGLPRAEFLLLRKAQYLADLGRAEPARVAAQASLDAVGKLPAHLQALPAAQAVRADASALLQKLSPSKT